MPNPTDEAPREGVGPYAAFTIEVCKIDRDARLSELTPAELERIVEAVSVAALNTRATPAQDELVKALESECDWLASVAACNMDKIVADGGITAGMVVRQEAGHRLTKLRATLSNISKGPEK